MTESIEPAFIPEPDLPLLVLADHAYGPIEWGIKLRTGGFYNHIMWIHRNGFFASQGMRYAEVPLKAYMRKGSRLKFIQVTGLTPVQKKIIVESIEKKLALPWYKTRYDFLGIFGQLIGINRINSPWADYCSEDVSDHLVSILDYVEGDLQSALANFPRHGSPEDCNAYFKAWSNVFRVYGRWDSDETAHSG